jgi:hypothetical protein
MEKNAWVGRIVVVYPFWILSRIDRIDDVVQYSGSKESPNLRPPLNPVLAIHNGQTSEMPPSCQLLPPSQGFGQRK